MSEMGGTSFNSAFRSCLREMIFDSGVNEEEYFTECHKNYLNDQEESK